MTLTFKAGEYEPDRYTVDTGIALLRGRVMLRSIPETHAVLVLPESKPRATKIHRGRVLAMGAPARSKWGHEVDPGFGVGDDVLFVYVVALEKARRYGDDVVFVAQEEIIAVIDPTPEGSA